MAIVRSPTAMQELVEAHETPVSTGPPDFKGDGGGGADQVPPSHCARSGAVTSVSSDPAYVKEPATVQLLALGHEMPAIVLTDSPAGRWILWPDYTAAPFQRSASSSSARACSSVGVLSLGKVASVPWTRIVSRAARSGSRAARRRSVRGRSGQEVGNAR
jgi:hypothetical protein